MNNKYTVLIHSDGSVITQDTSGITMDEFTGKLSILHKIIKYTNNKNKKDLAEDLRIYDPVFIFRVSGNANKELVIPKDHIVKFNKYLTPHKDDIDFSVIAAKLGITEEELNNNS